MDDELDGFVEQHTKQCTGWWLPIEAVKLFEAKKISAKELLLLASIDSLVDRETGRGCFASNAYLARMFHIEDLRTIQRMIAKLKRLKVIIDDGPDERREHQRYLRTQWPRANDATPLHTNDATPRGRFSATQSRQGY